MKSKMLLIVLVFPLFMFAQSSKKEHDFRNADWGMSPSEVEKSESIELNESDNYLVGSSTLAGMPVIVYYGFTKNKLTTSCYLFNLDHSNRNDYIDDFSRLKEFLIKKYGKPDTDSIIWHDDLYRDDSSNWGLAIAADQLEYLTLWELEKHSILLGLSGENFHINLGISYYSKEYEELRKNVQDKETLDDL